MLRRLLALWLVLPPATEAAAWLSLWPDSSHCGHEFCTCRDHCERKPVKVKPCHEEEAPELPFRALSDACHAEEKAHLLAIGSYLPPLAPSAPERTDAPEPIRFRAAAPLFGFERIDLPPPRSFTS